MRYRLVILFSIILASCAEKESPQLPPKPANLIPENKIIPIMADMHLLEATLGIRVTNAPQVSLMRGASVSQPQAIVSRLHATSKSFPYYPVFKKYGVTREQYDASITWYAAQPQLFSLMYDQVIDELSKRQSASQSRKK
jgi:hypothetical protein